LSGAEESVAETRYIPLWRREIQTYLKMLRDDCGRCFAPKYNSVSFAISAERTASQYALLENTTLASPPPARDTTIVRNPVSNGSSEEVAGDAKMQIQISNVSSAENVRRVRDSLKSMSGSVDGASALAKIGVSGCLDDDGVAIFWKKDRFEPVSAAEFAEISPNVAAVKVRLRDKVTTRVHTVASAHLKSGSNAKAQRARASQLRVIKRFLSPVEATDNGGGDEESKDKARTDRLIFCLDANSEPEERVWEDNKMSKLTKNSHFSHSNLKKTEKGRKKDKDDAEKKEVHTAYRFFRDLLRLQTCWDKMIEQAKREKKRLGAVTVNKIRGPLSEQHEKIGKHALGVIDYICFSAAYKASQFALEPMMLGSQGPYNAQAIDSLIPNLNVPSDHYPVVFDLMEEEEIAAEEQKGSPY